MFMQGFSETMDQLDAVNIVRCYGRLGVSTKTPLNVVQEKNDREWFAIGKLRPIYISKVSDANKMCLLKAWLMQLQHMDWNQSS